jgi:hypothetical protein
MFSEKLTGTLKRRESCRLEEEKPYAVLGEIKGAPVNTHSCPYCHDGHQTGMHTGSDEMSFDFPNASCEDVDHVISLENSVCDEPPCSPPEPEPPAESVSEPGPVPEFSPTKEAEDTERKKEEEEVEEEAPVAATVAAATGAANNLSWAEPTPGSDDWGSFAATATTGKKKKGKKGKVRHLGYVMISSRALISV